MPDFGPSTCPPLHQPPQGILLSSHYDQNMFLAKCSAIHPSCCILIQGCMVRHFRPEKSRASQDQFPKLQQSHPPYIEYPHMAPTLNRSNAKSGLRSGSLHKTLNNMQFYTHITSNIIKFYTYIYIYIYMCIYVCMYVCIYIYTYLLYIYMYIYICISKYIPMEKKTEIAHASPFVQGAVVFLRPQFPGHRATDGVFQIVLCGTMAAVFCQQKMVVLWEGGAEEV